MLQKSIYKYRGTKDTKSEGNFRYFKLLDISQRSVKDPQTSRYRYLTVHCKIEIFVFRSNIFSKNTSTRERRLLIKIRVSANSEIVRVHQFLLNINLYWFLSMFKNMNSSDQWTPKEKHRVALYIINNSTKLFLINPWNFLCKKTEQTTLTMHYNISVRNLDWFENNFCYWRNKCNCYQPQ